jgi:DNA polymerase-4
MPMRSIFHLDMDAFFVSVEELYDPSLRGKPVVVGGARDQRGVVSAASYAARKFGVHSAMPLRLAAERCPQAIFIEGHPDRYRDASRKVREVLEQFTPAIEMASIDEAYLDMTGTERLHGPAFAAAHKLHEAVRRQTDLNCSIGASQSRLVSKIASDQAKPNGILWIPPGCERNFLGPLDVRKVPGVGKALEARLHTLGLRKVADLARQNPQFLERHFGQWGVALAGKAEGRDAGAWFRAQVGENDGPKSISHERTFDTDQTDHALLIATLTRLSEMVAERLRAASLNGRTIQLKLRYSGFVTLTRSKTLPAPTCLDGEISNTVRSLFDRAWNGSPVRLLGVGVAMLEGGAGQQDLFRDAEDRRWSSALQAVDEMRRRFGPKAVGVARGITGQFRERTHEALPDLPSPAEADHGERGKKSKLPR